MNKNSKVLALKYRPQVFEDLIGQDIVAETIINSIKAEGTRFDEKVDISNIFKVRKAEERLNSMNIENTNERLRAAVNKEPDPSLFNRPNDLSKKLTQPSKSTLNSFFQKTKHNNHNIFTIPIGICDFI